MKVNPLNENFFSKKINNSFNIFFFCGNNFGLIDICYSELKKYLEIDPENPFTTNYFDENKLLNNSESFFDSIRTIVRIPFIIESASGLMQSLCLQLSCRD